MMANDEKTTTFPIEPLSTLASGDAVPSSSQF